MSVVYRNKNRNYGDQRTDKAVSFDEGRDRVNAGQSRPHSTGNISTLNTLNKGYSTNNLYWGFKQEDIQRGPSTLSENQSKFIQSRITSVEKHFGDLCTNFGAFSRKLGRVRDKGDELGKSLVDYADHESLNHTTKTALKEFVENFSGVQDFREIQVKNLDTKVVAPLSAYGHQCKVAKEQLKKAFSARDKEVKQKKKLDTVRDKKPGDRHTLSQAESDLHRAAVDASHTSRMLEDEMDSFEKKKLGDIKSILLDFVNVELLYHAKALEMYTMCYQALSTIDEEEDLQEFRNSLRPPVSKTRMQMQKTGSRTSLNSTGQSYTQSHETPPRAKQRNSAPAHMNDTMNTTSQYTNDEDEDDDEDDDDDEEDSEEEESEEESEEEETETEPPHPRPSAAQQGQKKTPQYSIFQAQSPQAVQRRK